MWEIEHDNAVEGGFHEWWEVKKGDVTFKSSNQDHAHWLRDTLNWMEANVWGSQDDLPF